MSERPTAQCPHCQSIFHISNSQIETAAGKVRCGNCLEPFLVDITQPDDKQSDDKDLPLLTIKPGSLADSEWASGIKINPLEEYYDTETKSRKVLATTALLLLLIPVQLLWFNSCDYYRQAALHNWVKWLPAPLSCKAARQIDRSYLGLQHTKVASKQNTIDTLDIDTLLTNRANYKISYPALTLTFFSDRGSTVAQRVFCPLEYLSGEAFGQSEIPPGRDVHLAFSIIDPGLVANRYQLSISESPCLKK